MVSTCPQSTRTTDRGSCWDTEVVAKQNSVPMCHCMCLSMLETDGPYYGEVQGLFSSQYMRRWLIRCEGKASRAVQQTSTARLVTISMFSTRWSLRVGFAGHQLQTNVSVFLFWIRKYKQVKMACCCPEIDRVVKICG